MEGQGDGWDDLCPLSVKAVTCLLSPAPCSPPQVSPTLPSESRASLSGLVTVTGAPGAQKRKRQPPSQRAPPQLCSGGSLMLSAAVLIYPYDLVRAFSRM